ncbi:MAG: tRNA lysidine(34) synthetase TilS [Ruminococcus sp.]|nr:tRNA lysidine(34) synthetase TilS [Ruminococcus sp.]MBR6669976.1 tRNA lysidine(34) synthetase TilS [Ruminococcus sp.]
MLEKIINFTKKFNMLLPDITVVVGLSGGADSICLTTVLNELSHNIGFKLEAVHVNHNLRNAESDNDQLFCEQFCRNLGIPLKVVSCNVSEYAQKNKLSIEEAARIMRYKVFADCSVGKFIATAHNADDNLETVIHNLIRGTAVKGLAGIPPVRDNIIRPLLNVTRAEIEQYLSENNIDFVVDSSNLSDDYTRNKIRHNLIPVMSDINSSLLKTSVSTINAVNLENSFIEEQTDIAYSKCRTENGFTGLLDFHKAIRHRCYARLLTEYKLPYNSLRLEQIDSALLESRKINISKDFYIVCTKSSLSVVLIKKTYSVSPIKLQLGENHLFSDKTLCADIVSHQKYLQQKNINKKFAIYFMDYDKIKGDLFIRNRKFGDKIQLAGRNFTSSVKKLINEKIPTQERPFLHFIDDEMGTVFAEKFGVAQRVAPDELTTEFLRITIIGD